MNIGFIGLGNMGAAIAASLLRAGHTLTVWNRTQAKAAPLAAAGARVAETPAAVAAGCDVVMTMLADDHAVDAAVFGSGGLRDTLPAGAIHVCLSTISVALARRLAAAHAGAGQHYLSAPVFGRPDAAAAARLFVVAAGPQAALATCRTLFEAIGQRVFVMGEAAEAANLVKLSGNFLIASVIEALAEAIALVRKGGVDPAAYLDLLTATLFGAPVYRTYGELIVKEAYHPPGMKLPLGLKDIRLVLAAAEDAAVPLPVASLIRDHFLTLLAREGEDLDWSALGLLAADNAGLPRLA